MGPTVTIDKQMAWVVTDRETGHTQTFTSKQAVEMHLDWKENRLPRRKTETAPGWRSLLLLPLSVLGF